MIHDTAIIEPGAIIGENVQIGPYSYIGATVEIGADNVIASHVVIKGPTVIGRGNHFYQFTSIGEDCQDKKYQGEPTQLRIGEGNIFRESVTVHRGTIQDEGITIIGDHNLFMANAHVAHDCVIGNDCVFANTVTLAGHVRVGDGCIMGGFVGVHQFCHIGGYSFCAAGAIVVQDVPPYVMASANKPGNKATPSGINNEGLKRRGKTSTEISAIRRAYKILYRQGLTIKEVLPKIQELAEEYPDIKSFIFFLEQSSRGIIR